MADDRGRGDDNHSDKDDESGIVPGDEPGSEPRDESGDESGDEPRDERRDQLGDSHEGPGDEDRPREESPFGLPLNRPGGGSPGRGSGPVGFGAGSGSGAGGFGGGFPGLPDLGGMD